MTLLHWTTRVLLSTALLAYCATPALATPWQTAPVDEQAQADDHPDHEGHAEHAEERGPPAFRVGPWSDTIIGLAESLPIQDGGRIKPLHTFANFSLLRFSGKRSVVTATEEKLTPIEWLLDSMFYPERARDYPVFLVDNLNVLAAMGLDTSVLKPRDRYSFNQLAIDDTGKGINKLFDLAREYRSIDPKERTLVQDQVFSLANNVDDYSYRLLGSGLQLALIPPDSTEPSDDEWVTADFLLRKGMNNQELTGRQETALRCIYDLSLFAMDGLTADFNSNFAELHRTTVAMAKARDEYETIELELGYYKANWITRSKVLYLIGFLVTAVLWLRPRNKIAYGLGWALTTCATMALITAIVYRCVIRGRPPISTLYESVIFVTAFGAVTGLVIEWINRQRIGLSAAAMIGVIGVFIASGYEILDKQDTMPSLVAVLDTNFWLATHVTCISIGYSSGLLAALLASIYLVAKVTRRKRDDPTFYRNLARMAYGVLCFSLIFSIVGTILGGVWANESWGRFWGWDPKENGALLIVLSQILILHGRMGGYLREFGVCIATAFGGTVIAFSWWGVNLLGVGLHSYGFTSGISDALWSYYGLQWALCAAGLLVLSRERSAKKAG
ncbi:MAG: ABC-type transport system involved in cytochrome c biogenesis permease subunit [Pseudohongiellaceae bacterium]|jgi:ABC-type transport system involved in cytochrome c biogenesis permease subunit